jgi:hypothetical protein
VNDFHNSCKLQLLDAAEELFGTPRPHPHPHRFRRSWRRPQVFAAVAIGALLLAAAAYAAGRLIGIGAPVRPSSGAERPTRFTGIGRPVAGSGDVARGASVLAMSVADPGGGLRWGLRIVTTTRGLLCMQVGRLRDGRLGILGQEGQFKDDGLFHELPPGALNQSTCSQRGVLVLYNATHERRQLAFGLLGPHAVSVTYKSAGRLHTVASSGSHGAYLIVLPQPAEPAPAGAPTAAAFVAPEQLPAAAIQAYQLSAIEFRFGGRHCQIDSEPQPGGLAHCATAVTGAPSRFPAAGGELHSRVVLRASRDATGVFRLDISFVAPVSVTNASTAYAAEYAPQGGRLCHAGNVGQPIERDIRRGQTVHVTMLFSPQPGCHGPIQGRIVVGRQSSALSGPTYDETSIGRFSFAPPGTGHP